MRDLLEFFSFGIVAGLVCCLTKKKGGGDDKLIKVFGTYSVEIFPKSLSRLWFLSPFWKLQTSQSPSLRQLMHVIPDWMWLSELWEHKAYCFAEFLRNYYQRKEFDFCPEGVSDLFGLWINSSHTCLAKSFICGLIIKLWVRKLWQHPGSHMIIKHVSGQINTQAKQKTMLLIKREGDHGYWATPGRHEVLVTPWYFVWISVLSMWRGRGAGALLVWGAGGLLSTHPFPGPYDVCTRQRRTHPWQNISNVCSLFSPGLFLLWFSFFCFSNYMARSSD